MNILEPATHTSDFIGKLVEYTALPANPEDGDMCYITTGDLLYRYNGDSGYWEGFKMV